MAILMGGGCCEQPGTGSFHYRRGCAPLYLRVSERTVYRLIEGGQRDAFKVGEQWLIIRGVLRSYMQQNGARLRIKKTRNHR
jgi:excisionase family DNA binding protein